ncbi:FecCD family ABC transporter permease [Vibrio mangrovi]|nr:iron chelate uptake ABC transporter family permease subunit [Vibrio mangrovi]MDW6003035.1 iron chelate uptake ABC transporter family permease subunit [Vibrio mangrovi]
MSSSRCRSEMSRVSLMLTSLSILVLLLCGLSLSLGEPLMTVSGWFDFIRGETPAFWGQIIGQWRVPHLLLALLLGAALGVSGAVFQSVLRNPLASPDIIGLNTGAYTGVLLMISFGVAVPLGLMGAAMLGSGITALMVYLLAWQGGMATFRLLIIGIGLRAMLMALNTWFILQSSLENAMSASLWSAGSLNGLNWEQVYIALPIIIVLMLALLPLRQAMSILEMGDHSASGLGVSVEFTRCALLSVGVGLTAVVTVIAGPISFVALMAPQLARKLLNTERCHLRTSALTGAVLLLGCDLIAQFAFSPYRLPIGVVVVSIGGLYLLMILMKEARR